MDLATNGLSGQFGFHAGLTAFVMGQRVCDGTRQLCAEQASDVFGMSGVVMVGTDDKDASTLIFTSNRFLAPGSYQK